MQRLHSNEKIRTLTTEGCGTQNEPRSRYRVRHKKDECRTADAGLKAGATQIRTSGKSRSLGRHHPNLRKTSARWGPRRRGDLVITTFWKGAAVFDPPQ